MPNILKSLKIIYYYSSFFICALSEVAHRLGRLAAPEEPVEEVVELDSAGRPITLRAGKKVKLKLAERTKLSRDVVLYTFALPSPEHVLGLPVGVRRRIKKRFFFEFFPFENE